MTWNLELLCIDQPDLPEIELLVPSGFEATENLLSFDQMIKALRSGALAVNLYVAQHTTWTVIFSGDFTLSTDGDYLEEVSAGGDAYMVRIAQSPLLYHYHQGLPQTEHQGIEGCIRGLGKEKLSTPKVTPYGEALAMEMLQLQTDLTFPASFQAWEYHEFSPSLSER